MNSIPPTISDSIVKAPMATAKDYIPHKSLLSHFADCVRQMVYSPSSLKITCSIDRLAIVRECRIALYSLRQLPENCYSGNILPPFTISEYSYATKRRVQSLIYQSISVVGLKV
jgi:hypothetical protein